MIALNHEDLKNHFPVRDKNAHKYTNGMVFAFVGSKTYPGAAVLSAKAVMASGAGGVYVASDSERVGNIVLGHLPEAIVLTNDSSHKDNFMLRAHCFFMGSGQEVSIISDDDFQKILFSQKPTVLDAGGIDKLKSFGHFEGLQHIILTPNIPEAVRLVDAEDLIETVNRLQELSRQSGCTILLKGAEPVLFSLGKIFELPPTNSAATTAGCGDVLAGMISGLLAQGVNPFYAVTLASVMINDAVRHYLSSEGAHTILASDIIRLMPKVLASCVQNKSA